MTALAVIAARSGAVVLPNEGTRYINRLQIKSSSSSRLYTVSFDTAVGQWCCNCPGWVVKKPNKPRGCKHLTAMMPALATLDAPKADTKGIR